MKRAMIAAAVMLAAGLGPAAAQSYRTTVETRRVTGPLAVDISFAVGSLVIRPADEGQTYRLALRYAEDYFQPAVRYDAGGGRLTVELEGDDFKVKGDIDADEQSLDLALPPDVPLDLKASFGALEASIELGGMTLRSAEIKTGASATTLSFETPTRGTCERLELHAGAAEFEVLGLGNAGCRVVSLKGAIGEMLLDFSGERLTGQTRVVLNVGLGEVTLRIPESVGIRLDATRFLASVDRAGLVRRGSAYESPDFDAATAKLVIDANAVLGSIDIERTR